MKLRALIFLLLLSVCSFAQFKNTKLESIIKPELPKTDTITLTQLQLTKLMAIEKQLSELEEKKKELVQKQKDLIELIFDNKNIVADKVKELRYDNGKLIYSIQ